jgi:hypothetical protein
MGQSKMTETAALKAAREQRERSEKKAREARMRYQATRWPSSEPRPGAPGGRKGSFRDLITYLEKNDRHYPGATIHFRKGEPY